MKKIIFVCVVMLCFFSSCKHDVYIVEAQSITIHTYTDTVYTYKVIGKDSVVEELTSNLKLKKGEKTFAY